MKQNNRNFQRFVAVSAATAAVIAAGSPAAQAATLFTDVTANTYYATPVKFFAENGVISGYKDNTFKPDQTITRAEAAKMISTLFDMDTDNVEKPSFTDLNENAWYYAHVAALSQAGVINGYENNTFRPNDPIERGEMAKILVEAFQTLDKSDSGQTPFSDVDADKWYSAYISALIDNEITTGKTATTFAPHDIVTRAEAATFLYRAEMVKTIEAINGNIITISDTEYEISEEASAILNDNNSDILAGAKINFTTENDAITGITYLELRANGQAAASGEEEFSGNLVLDGGDVTIQGDLKVNGNYLSVKNVTIEGDLEIGKKLENDFQATNIEVKGKTIINGGDDNTVVFNKSKLGAVDVNKRNVRLEGKGGTTVQDMTVNTDATISGDDTFEITNATVTEKAKQLVIDTIVKSLTLPDSMTAGEGNSGLTLGERAKIESLNLPAGKTAKDVVSNYEEKQESIGTVTNREPVETTTETTEEPTTQEPTSGGAGGGGGAGSGDVTAVAPTVNSFSLSGVNFDGSGTTRTATVSSDIRIKNINLSLNVDADYEILELQDSSGLNLLDFDIIRRNVTSTTGSLDSGSGTINVVQLFGIDDEEDNGVSASSIADITSSFTIKIKLYNASDSSKSTTYTLTVNIE